MKENKTRTLNTKISESELEQFDAVAFELHTTRSKLLRSLVKTAIKNHFKGYDSGKNDEKTTV